MCARPIWAPSRPTRRTARRVSHDRRTFAPPIRIYVNGKIVTVDAGTPLVEALAVKDGKSSRWVRTATCGNSRVARTEVIDLAGKTVLPGINDSHTHAAMYGSSQPPLTLDLGFPAVKSIADIREAVRRRAAEPKPGEWIHGNGWDYGYLEECLADRSRALSKHDLDDVAPDNPVFLIDFSQHRLVANSKALETGGHHQGHHTEPGSEIVKDPATGEPTGHAGGTAGPGLLMRAVPLWTRAEKRAAIETMMRP